MLAQPVALVAPVRALPLDEGPEPPRMVRDLEVTELMHDHIVEYLERRQHKPPVERERAARRARAPERPLTANEDPLVSDRQPPGRLSVRTRSTSSRLVDRGTVSRAGSPHGTSSRHRCARGDRRTSTSSISGA